MKDNQDSTPSIQEIATPDQLLRRFVEQFAVELNVLAQGGMQSVISVSTNDGLAAVIVGIGPDATKVVTGMGSEISDRSDYREWTEKMKEKGLLDMTTPEDPQSN